MPIVVQKYGGSSVATPERLAQVARLVVDTKHSGKSVVVVVSAMGNTTDELLALAQKMAMNPPRRELDMLVSCGERISMALLSMAIGALGEEAISFTGSQSGIITSDNHFAAKILEVRPVRIVEALERGKIVIVAGYQGMSVGREITTLGRGGSDTTAVALAAALDAEACEIYSDVAGVYSADPRQVPDAVRLPSLSYAEMETFAGAGAKVLNQDAVAFAKAAGIQIHARKTGAPAGEETIVQKTPPLRRLVAGVARKSNMWRLEGPAAQVGELLLAMALAGAKPEGMIGDARSFACWLDLENVPDPSACAAELRAAQGELTQCELVSLVGENLAQNCEAIAGALTHVPKERQLVVEPHRLVASVSAEQGLPLILEWHRHFVGNRRD